MKDSVIIISGGMDSTTLLYDMKERIALGVSFDYGSNHNAREIPLAAMHCQRLGIEHLTLSLGFMHDYFKSSLLEGADAIPEGERRAAGEIDGALKELQKLGYIDIRYARGDMYCVAALKAALPDEKKEDEKTQNGAACPTVVEVKQKFSKIAAAAYAAAAFLGGAAGSAIVCAIFAAV